jgi:hypothetical protein
MKKARSGILLMVFILFLGSWSGMEGRAYTLTGSTIAVGEQPQISADDKGIIRVVFGREDKIYCSSSRDQGITFSDPVLVARVADMHLGMSRGPQLASSKNYSIITAIDKTGNIHWFRLDHLSDQWKDMGMINDLKGSGPEGLMSIAADNNDNFYAVWLDIRIGKHNQIYFSSLSPNTNNWSKNRLVYRSPDGHVCECCKPGIFARGSELAIMFRNWLDGSRDLYLLRSPDRGRSFKKPQKLGFGTWKLNGCPMDGGGVLIDRLNTIQTTWQREGTVYYSELGEKETDIGKGRICSISRDAGQTVISMQTGDTVKLVSLPQRKWTIVGTGGYLRSILLPGEAGRVLCVWEQNRVIKFRRL